MTPSKVSPCCDAMRRLSRANFVTGVVVFPRRGRLGQTRPEGDGAAGALDGTGAVGLPDLIAAMTTAQAKNSRSRS